MKTLGVDLAAAAKKTAVAVIEWSTGSARLVHLGLGAGDEEIVNLFAATDMTGIDCPVGWPDALVPFLTGTRPSTAGPSWHTTASRDGGGWHTGTQTVLSRAGRA